MKIARKMFLCALLLIVLNQRKQADAQAPSGEPQRGITLAEAVQSTLLNHPLLSSQQAQVEISRGQLEQQSGFFDSITQAGIANDRNIIPLTRSQIQQNEHSGIFDQGQATSTIKSTIAVDRTFRNGITITPGFTLGRSTDNLFNTNGLNTSNTSVAITFPLLRGRGRRVVAAQELAAVAEVDATIYDLNQLISQLVVSTTTSYWNLVAARKNLSIAYDAEARGKNYVENVVAMADADHAPRNDVHEVTGNYAQRTAQRWVAEQQVVAAEVQLALDMGKSSGNVLTQVSEPVDDLPAAAGQSIPSDSYASMQYYLEQALEHRADYQAARRRSAESAILLHAAKNKLLPQINFSLATGYSGLNEGHNANSFFGASVFGVRGPNANAGITYSFAKNNQTAKGQLMQANGLARQAELHAEELARDVSAEVVIAVGAVRNAVLRMQKAHEAVEAFQAALDGEREKYRGGIGSVVDVLTVEDKLTSALSEEVQARQAYALALIQFRFATGTLLDAPGESVQKIEIDKLLTLPFTKAP